MYLKQDGTLGIEEGVASIVERSDDSLRVLAMFNTNSQAKTIKLQADFVPKIIRSVQINSDAPLSVKGRLATISLPPDQLVRVTLRVTGSDTIPPLTPANLRSTASSGSSISIAWATPSPAMDNETAALYQVKRNGVQVTRTDSLTFTDIGLQEGTLYRYDVYSIDMSGNFSNTSATGNFSTVADRVAPALLSATLSDSATLVLRFNEIVTLATATVPSNYTISPGIQVLQAVRSSDKMGVTLKTSAHQERTPYTVMVKNVTDSSIARNAMSGAQVSYTLIRTLSIRNLSLSNYKVKIAANGDSVFVDRAYTIQTLPDALLKQWRIATANNDKGNTSTPFFTFTVNQYVNVYVAYDRRLTTLPSWLQSWTATTSSVKTSDSEYLCYRKNFPPGTVSLGGNYGTGSCSMYMIFVEPGNDRTPPSPPTGLVALPWSE
jgi:chitodextrinase